jgi:hypothetical protein
MAWASVLLIRQLPFRPEGSCGVGQRLGRLPLDCSSQRQTPAGARNGRRAPHFPIMPQENQRNNLFIAKSGASHQFEQIVNYEIGRLWTSHWFPGLGSPTTGRSQRTQCSCGCVL